MTAEPPPGRRAGKAPRSRPQTAFLLIAWLSVAAVVALFAFVLLAPDQALSPRTGTTAVRLPTAPPRTSPAP